MPWYRATLKNDGNPKPSTMSMSRKEVEQWARVVMTKPGEIVTIEVNKGFEPLATMEYDPKLRLIVTMGGDVKEAYVPEVGA